ncbi:hypothetical protein PYW07_015275 [Mythimna separata]|uniref:M-AAA protease-interacting protein 1, mitochondrial n=1 Tax=Mythimna separata TaxID=271217 RepID=A0AAD8DYT5_MYTSE|nr:hypothetical protein PYW07_015275 [Mythimna separata]
MMASPMLFLPRRLCPFVTRVFEANKYNKFSAFIKTCPIISQNINPYFSLAPHFNNSSILEYRQLNPQSNDRGDVILSRVKSSLSFVKSFRKSFSWGRKRDLPRKRRVPKLILLQNPLTWLMIKIDFSVLRNIWDPLFVEKEFKYGTKQAISRVTNVISKNQLKDLQGLLTKPARLSLMRELDRNWGDKQRSLLALNIDDIQISSPRKVYFIRIADKKYCDVDMAFLALKWAPINSVDALIFTEIFARFHREYTPHCIPEWTIAYFKVTRFEVLRR